MLIATEWSNRPLYQASSLSRSFIIIGVEHGVFNLETQNHYPPNNSKVEEGSTWGTENSFILAKHPVKEAWLSLLHLIWPWYMRNEMQNCVFALVKPLYRSWGRDKR